MAELQKTLPSGWESKYDMKSERWYFINHVTKTTTWDDPRQSYKTGTTPMHTSNIQLEHIPMQHGSPELRRNYVYPSQPSPIPAFQIPGQNSPKYIPLKDMKNSIHGSPYSVRSPAVQDTSLIIPVNVDELVLKINTKYPTVGENYIRMLLKKYHNRETVVISTLAAEKHPTASSLNDGAHVNHSPSSIRGTRLQENILPTTADTDESVTKIGAMFPTVSDTHIRLLLKKYHNREAVVISALQVEKHPITTPGPFTTPPPIRNITNPFQMTPPLGFRTGSRMASPILRPCSASNNYTGSPRNGDAFRNSPRPHSSPKLKLRYMKSIFPKAEETVILDVLANNDNNIQKTSDVLKEMGYEKRDVLKILQQQAQEKAKEEAAAEIILLQSPNPAPKLLSPDDKTTIKNNIQEKYKDIPEKVLVLALESVEFDENKAQQILDIMLKEDQYQNNDPKSSIREEEDVTDSKTTLLTTSQSKQSLKSLLKSDLTRDKSNLSWLIEESHGNSNRETYAIGHNESLVNGPNDNLLLEEYIKWLGPNMNIVKGPNSNLVNGPNRSLLSKRYYKPIGANPEMRKGPQIGLAKGSIFSQLKNAFGESRGK